VESAIESSAAVASRMKVPLVIIVLNFRTPDLTVDCLRSLEPEIPKLPGTRVVLVENGSGDDSAVRLQNVIDDSGWEDWITLEILEKNLGFAGGNKRGLEVAPESRYVLLLNSDTTVHAGAIRHCYEQMEAAERIGAISCMVLNGDGSVQNVARRFPSPARLFFARLGLPRKLPRFFEWSDIEDLGWDRRTTRRDVDWLGGAFLFLRRDLIRRIGFLDADFFFMGEDVEICHRIWRSGYRCTYDPATEITHLGARSSDGTHMWPSFRTEQEWRSRYMVQRKCYGSIAAALARSMDLCSWAVCIPWRRLSKGREDPSYSEAVDIFQLLCTRL
jgi:N-acetylglucosaminyl-diphospho-decaprenol L-rhamnosyltransferase